MLRPAHTNRRVGLGMRVASEDAGDISEGWIGGWSVTVTVGRGALGVL